MANGIGTAVIDFGAFPGLNESSVIVTGETAISATSKAEAYVMADDTTSDHSANDHSYLPMLAFFTCGAVSAGVGFTIFARSEHKMQGTFTLRWVWSD